MIQLSRRSAYDARPNALTTALAAHRAAGRRLWDLTASNPTTVGLAWPAPTLAEALASPEGATYRPEPFGLPAARAAVAAAQLAPVDPARVVLTASTSEAYGFVFKALCDPGDHLVALVPGYPLFEQIARYEGVVLDPVALGWDGAWHVDLPAVRAAMGPRTRGILVVSPNNPTGQYLRPAELEALASLGVPVLVDEVFARYPHAGPRHTALRQPDLPWVVLGGLSKRCGLPQMKLGWMIIGGPDRFAAPLLERLELIADTWLSLATPVQHGLPALLADPGGVGQRIHARTQANLAALRSATVGSAAQLRRVEGGWYAVLELPRVRSEEAWALSLLAAGVRVQPGWFYDFPREAFAVISLLTRPMEFAEGVDRVLAEVAGASG